MKDKLEVYLPYPKSTISQRFGENANTLYKNDGLLGHPSYDWVVPYGTPIPNCIADSYCYAILHKNDPVLMDYRAACFIVETKMGVYEIVYGHMSEILAEVGKTYQVGNLIGKIGNTGDVFVGQHEVTEGEKRSGSHAGSHLHGPQIRVLAKTKFTNKYQHYIYDANGFYQDKDGYYYGIPNYSNGYNGTVSLAPFSTETLAIPQPTNNSVQQIVDAIPPIIKEIDALPGAQQSSFRQLLINVLQSLSKLIRG